MDRSAPRRRHPSPRPQASQRSAKLRRRRRDWKRGSERSNNNRIAPASFSNSPTARLLVAEVEGDVEYKGIRCRRHQLDNSLAAPLKISRSSNYRPAETADSRHAARFVANNVYSPSAVDLEGLVDGGKVAVRLRDTEAPADEITDAG